ncbi:hypothetical protein SNOG_07952 [Parastagonospora nodorum SN15]|uniref:Uncharacterized protein n=1 Tax=Phaeosphaeria nodorum (strain SN15 / ATCC MYA-4574 / FGSC 10173) TaxID=321614 RepID=Q0UJW2_PHANO|nr:hypothetical protein SNOG_07952 [Parastagonospora nodorum SN15]EAT84228.1 hypothetical protein SNOG_07952 [Parastagonospora nodorum SN15]
MKLCAAFQADGGVSTEPQLAEKGLELLEADGRVPEVVAAPQGCSWEHMDNVYNCLDAMCLLGGRGALGGNVGAAGFPRQLVPVLTGGVAGCIMAGAWPK